MSLCVCSIDLVSEVHLGHPSNKEALMSAKKTAFCDVKNLLGNTNTPNVPAKSSGLKKPVFGSQFKASNPIKVTPSETKGSGVSGVLLKRNYKPRIDLGAIDYSDNEPHLVCKPAGNRDILFDFWSAACPNFDVYTEPAPKPRTIELPEISFVSPATTGTLLDSTLFDDIPSFSFNDL